MATYFGVLHKSTVHSSNGSTWIIAKPWFEKDGAPTLSQDCASMAELNKAIDALRADLERVRSEGAAVFSAIAKTKATCSE